MGRIRTLLSLASAAALAAMLHWAQPAPEALANGNPVTIVLSYLSGFSNWGPTGATGVAELVPREGEARISAAGLSRLSGEQYVVWIMNSGTGERMALGGFTVAEDGVGKLEVTTPEPFPDRGWDTVFISVEPAGPVPAQASNRRSIAGRWPIPGTQQGAPRELPNTGGVVLEFPATRAAATVPWLAILGGLLLVIAVSGALGFRMARAAQRRSEG